MHGGSCTVVLGDEVGVSGHDQRQLLGVAEPHGGVEGDGRVLGDGRVPAEEHADREPRCCNGIQGPAVAARVPLPPRGSHVARHLDLLGS